MTNATRLERMALIGLRMGVLDTSILTLTPQGYMTKVSCVKLYCIFCA